MPQFTDIAIIYNPNSTGDAESMARELQTALQATLPTVACTMLPTERAGHASTLARDFASQKDRPLIVSASGDGGYNEVLNGALEAQADGATPTLAVLPAGNANDHARTMQDSPLLELITAGMITNFDVLQMSTVASDGRKASRYAHSYIGLGLTPTVAVELNKHTLNSLLEGWILLKTFWNLRPVRILMDDRTRELDSLICSIIPEMAKVLTISETSKPHDGLFEVTTFAHNRKARLLFRLARGVFKSLEAQRRTDQLEFTLLSPTPIQLDGEILELQRQTRVSVTICPRLLRTVASV